MVAPEISILIAAMMTSLRMFVRLSATTNVTKDRKTDRGIFVEGGEERKILYFFGHITFFSRLPGGEPDIILVFASFP